MKWLWNANQALWKELRKQSCLNQITKWKVSGTKNWGLIKQYTAIYRGTRKLVSMDELEWKNRSSTIQQSSTTPIIKPRQLISRLLITCRGICRKPYVAWYISWNERRKVIYLGQIIPTWKISDLSDDLLKIVKKILCHHFTIVIKASGASH